MLLILITSSIILAVSCMVMILASILSKKTFSDREKSSPFECGFDPSSSARVPFSLRFFLITIIFLIFDVEIALILPMAITMESSSFMAWSCTALGFILILLVGLYHEWNQGMLSWSA